MIFAEKPELLRRFRAGERAALETVYWEYVDLIGFVARRGSGRADVADDLVQETFARAFAERARLAYDGLRPYKPYLLTICRNLLADWAQKSGKDLSADLLTDDPQIEPDPPEAWAEPATVALVERYLAGLDPRLRAVYEQRYQQDRSQNQTAEALGLSRQRVRTLEERLRRGLSRVLVREGFK